MAEPEYLWRGFQIIQERVAFGRGNFRVRFVQSPGEEMVLLSLHPQIEVASVTQGCTQDFIDKAIELGRAELERTK